jgi:hypothetical protein
LAALSLRGLPAQATAFSTEVVPPAPVRLGSGLSIAVDATGTPHIVYGRDIDLNGSFRHAYKSAGAWHYGTIVDRGANYASLASHGGALAASYQDVNLTDCRFASFNGTLWSTELVSNLFPVEGLYTSLAFDASGVPHIAFQEGSGADNANHAYRPSSSWLAENADGFGTSNEEGRYTSIAVGPADSIFMSHIGIGSGGYRARLSELTAGGWQTVDIDPTLTGRGGTAVAVTSTGRPQVAFVAGSMGLDILYFASRSTPATWSIEPVDTLDGPADIAMKLDGLGQPHIVYVKGSILRHAVRDALEGWIRETVDSTPNASGLVDLAIDGSNALYIAYSSGILYPVGLVTNVRYAVKTSGGWSTEVVEGQDVEGTFLSLTTTTTGEPVVAFYDATLRSAQLGRRTAQNAWIADDVAEGGDVGRLVCMPARTITATNATLAFFDFQNARIVVTSGTYDAWSTLATIASGAGVASLSCADSSGWVRVAYYDSLAGDLLMARIGPGSPSVVPVDQVGDVGRSCSIGVTSDGVAHIAYFDLSSGTLKHADFAGGTWSFQTIASGLSGDGRCALATQAANVGVAYYDAGTADLYWGRLVGGTWTTGLIDATGDVGRGCSVAMDGALRLDVAYYDATNRDLRFARVTGAGTLAALDVVDAVGDVGSASAVAVDPTSGRADIIYYDAGVRQMKLAFEQPSAAGVDDEPFATLSDVVMISSNPVRSGGVVRVVRSGPGRVVVDAGLYDVQGREIVRMNPAGLGHGSESVEIVAPPKTAGVLFLRVAWMDGREFVRRVAVLP